MCRRYQISVRKCKEIIYREQHRLPGARQLHGKKVVVINRANGFAIDNWSVKWRWSASSFMWHAVKKDTTFGVLKDFSYPYTNSSCTFPSESDGNYVSEDRLREVVLEQDYVFRGKGRTSRRRIFNFGIDEPVHCKCGHMCFRDYLLYGEKKANELHSTGVPRDTL